MSEQHCPDGTCHGCYGCECLDNPDCFICNDRRETRKIERKRIIALLGTCPCGCPIEKCECGCGEEPEFTRNELIVLIKGGNE